MTEFPIALLGKPWDQQVDYLRNLSQKEMEVLWFLLQEHGESFDRLKIATFSILRDLYESQREVRPGFGNDQA
jgi:hypothetical protein